MRIYPRKSKCKPGGAISRLTPVARGFSTMAAKASSQAAVQTLSTPVAFKTLLRTAKVNYPAAKFQLMTATEKPFVNMRASLKNDKTPMGRKTFQTMRRILSTEDYVDFCMSFIFTDMTFKRGVNDLRFKMFEHYGVKRTEIRGFYKEGVREHWEYITEAAKVKKQTEQGLIYDGALHNLDHVVEIQTIITAFIEHQMRAAAGLNPRNNIKTTLTQSCNALISNNKTFIDDLKVHISSTKNLHIIEKNLNGLKQRVISKILYSKNALNKNDDLFITVSNELKAEFISYCNEIVIPYHNDLISFIESGHGDNELGQSIIQKCRKINMSLSNISGQNSKAGGFQSMEELEPQLDDVVSREILKQVYEDLNSEGLTAPIKTPSFATVVSMTVLNFLELRDYAFTSIQDLDKEEKVQLQGGRKTRKSKSILSKRAR